MHTPEIGCDYCTSDLTYRVKTEGNPRDDDNFDQVSDHLSQFFTSPMYLASVAESSNAQITVWHYPQGWTPDAEGRVIAFAGVDPESGDRVWFQNLPVLPVPS